MTSGCPSPIELERAYWSGNAAVAEHARGCTRCDGEWSEIAKLAAMGEAIEPSPISADRREELRATILSRIERPAPVRERRWIWFAAPLAAAAAALAIWWILPASPTRAPQQTPTAVERRSTVLDHAGARYLVASLQPDEIVRLVDGTISVRVDSLTTNERFRVIAGDAEVEARGGSFDATARADALVAVRAMTGEVVVRASGGETKTLRAGQTWELTAPPRQTASTAPPIIDLHPVRPERANASRRTQPDVAADVPAETPPAPPEADVAPSTPTPAMLAFDDAWRAMRANDFRSAAAAFERTVLADDTGPLAEDARFWRAAALARANLSTDAIAAFTAFLDRHPRSVRAGEASTMLGWLLLDRGDLDRAASLFTSATRDPSARVRDSAARGLRAVGAASAAK